MLSGPVGSDRVVIGLYDSPLGNLLAIKNFTDQVVPGQLNGGSTVAFSSNDATTMQPLPYSNVPTAADGPSTNVLANLGGGALTVVLNATTQYPQLPAGIFQSGDYYAFESSATVTSGAQQSLVGSVLYSASGGPVTLSFPALWSTAGPSAASLPTFTFDYAGYAGQPGILFDAGYSWWPVQNQQNRYFRYCDSELSMANTTSLTVPDLSGISGFLTPPAAATSVSWIEGMFQGTLSSSQGHPGGLG